MMRRFVPLVNCGGKIVCFHNVKFHTNASRVLYSRFNKDLPIPTLPTPLSKAASSDTDILLEQIRKAKTHNRILELTSMHLDVMNAKHIVASLEGIKSLVPRNDSNDLMENPTFQGLCSHLMKGLRFLDSQDLITVYKSLSALGVANNTYVMQALLKMIGSHLNDMNLGQLTFLSFLLNKQRHNPVVDGLRLALPLVLQVQIEQQLDSDNLTEVVDCLQLAARSKLKPATIQKVLSVVLSKAKSLSPSNAQTVIFALLNLDTPLDGYKDLFNYSLDIISKNLELSDAKQIIAIIRLCSVKNNFYNSRFCFTIADKIISEKWSLENTWDAVKTLYRLGFSTPNLQNHFVNAIRSDPNSFRNISFYSPLLCSEILTATGHRPPHVEEVLEILCSCTGKLEAMKEKSPYLFIKFLGCLAIMGYFPESLWKQALNEEFLFSTWSKSRKLGRAIDFENSLSYFMWSLVVYDRQQDFSLPSSVFKSIVNNAFERYSEYSCPLQSFIENGLGGSQFLMNGVFTQDGIIVDHVVAMRSGNFPVNLESSILNKSPQTSIYLEDMILPADAKIVSILVAYEDKYCRDPEVLKGYMELKVKCLAKKNLSPVVINYAVWRDLPDREKIPYLMKEIKSAIHEDSIANVNPFS